MSWLIFGAIVECIFQAYQLSTNNKQKPDTLKTYLKALHCSAICRKRVAIDFYFRAYLRDFCCPNLRRAYRAWPAEQLHTTQIQFRYVVRSSVQAELQIVQELLNSSIANQAFADNHHHHYHPPHFKRSYFSAW